MLSEKQIRNRKKLLMKKRRIITNSLRRIPKRNPLRQKKNILIREISAEIKSLREVLKGRPLNFKKLKSKRTTESFVQKMNRIKPLVREILKVDMESRDDDNVLCIRVWERQGSTSSMSLNRFESKLLSGTFSSPETIGRTRRAMQEKHVSLRGKLYDKRHQAEEKFRDQYKIEFP